MRVWRSITIDTPNVHVVITHQEGGYALWRKRKDGQHSAGSMASCKVSEAINSYLREGDAVLVADGQLIHICPN